MECSDPPMDSVRIDKNSVCVLFNDTAEVWEVSDRNDKIEKHIIDTSSMEIQNILPMEKGGKSIINGYNNILISMSRFVADDDIFLVNTEGDTYTLNLERYSFEHSNDLTVKLSKEERFLPSSLRYDYRIGLTWISMVEESMVALPYHSRPKQSLLLKVFNEDGLFTLWSHDLDRSTLAGIYFETGVAESAFLFENGGNLLEVFPPMPASP